MKLFTLEEADALLPDIKRLWRKIDRARGVMKRLAPEVRLASRQTGGGGIWHAGEYVNALTTFIARGSRRLLNQTSLPTGRGTDPHLLYFLKLKLVKLTPMPVVNSKSLFFDPGGGLEIYRLLAVTFQVIQLVTLVVSELSNVWRYSPR